VKKYTTKSSFNPCRYGRNNLLSFIKTFPKSYRTYCLNKTLLTRLLLASVSTLLCMVSSPILTRSTVVNSAVSSSQIIPSQPPDWIQQGKALYDAGQFVEAAKVFQQAASAAKAQKDSFKQAIALSDLSLAYQQLGQWPQATTAIADSLKLMQVKHSGSSKERLKILAQALNNQGGLQLALGQSQQALETWQQATNTYTKAGDRSGVTASMLNQVLAMQSLGLYLQAIDTLKQTDQNLQKLPDSLVKAQQLLSLGNAQQAVGHFDQSQQCLEQSLAIAQRLRSPSDIGEALLSLGNLARVQQKPQSALAFYQQAADASPTMKLQPQLNQLSVLIQTNQLDSAKTLVPQLQAEIANLPSSHSAIYSRIGFAQNLVRLRKSSSKDTPSWLEINQLLDASVQQAKSLGDSRAEAYALGNLGGLYEQTHQWSEAQDLTQRALILAQSINATDIGYRWQWQLGRLLKAQGDIKGAIAAYSGAVDSLKSLRNNLVGVNPDIQFSFRDEVEPIYRQLVDLLLQSREGSQPSQPNLMQARTVIESLQLAELNDFFRVACLEGRPVQLDEVVDHEDPTAAVIYPIILPDRLGVILKLPKQSSLRYYETTIAEKEVFALLENLQQTLKLAYGRQAIPSLSRQVYNWLIRPAETDLAKSQVKTLVFVLDGSLRNIPMSTLHDGQQYLIEKYAVALTPGLQLLAPKLIGKVDLKALTGGITESNLDFPPLPNVGAELAQIKSKIPGKQLLNQRFTRKNLQTEIGSTPFPIVHLATHGQFSSQADKTFILAWKELINVTELNDILQSRDTTSPDALELLVLSACETAAGDNRAVLGLAGISVQAGARSTLASLWSVEDRAVPLIMGLFYQNLVSKHMTKAEALRQTQIHLLRNTRYKAPYFWSAFVLLGNWL